MDSPVKDKTHYVRCLKCNKIMKCSRYDTNALLEHIRTDHKDIEVIDIDEDDSSSYKGSRGTAGCNVSSTENNNDEYKSNKNTTNGYNGTNGYQSSSIMQRKRNLSMREAAQNIVVPKLYPEPRGKEMKEKKDCEEPKPQTISSREGLHLRTHRSDSNCDCGVKDERSNNTTSGGGTYTRRSDGHAPFLQTPQADQPNRGLYRTSIEKWHPGSGTIYCPKCGANRRPLIRTQAQRSTNSSCCSLCILSCWPFCFLPFLVPSDDKQYLHCSNCKSFLGLYDRANNCVRPNREYLQPEDMDIKETQDDEIKERKNCRCA